MPLIQQKSLIVGGTLSDTPNLVFTSNVQAGNLLVAGISTRKDRRLTGVSDSLGNTWVPGPGTSNQAGAEFEWVSTDIWYCLASHASGPCTVTLTITTNSTPADLAQYLIAEFDAVSGVDTDDTNTAHGTSITFGTGAQTQPGLVVALEVNHIPVGTVSPPPSYGPADFTYFTSYNTSDGRAWYRYTTEPLSYADMSLALSESTYIATAVIAFITDVEDEEEEDPGKATCCSQSGPGGASTGTGYGGSGSGGGAGTSAPDPISTPRTIPPGGDAPSYSPCSTGGTPASAADPTDPQSLTDAVAPVVWLQLSLPDGTILRYSGHGAPFTSGTGVLVQPRVLSWGPISHALADHYGSIEAFRTSLTLSDADGVIRTHLASAANRHIDGREAILYVETRANAALGIAPRVLARGIVTTWKADTDLTLRLEISDPLGYRYSAISLDRPLPHRRIRAALFPSCPEQNLGRAVPIIYGDYSDDYTWSVDTARIPVGICPVIHVGKAADINGLGVTGADDAFVIAGHAIGGIQSVFGSNLHPTGPGSVRLPLNLAEFRLPGLNGWPRYHDVTGTDGTVERFAIMTGIGPRSDHHVDGTVPITLNVCGIEDVGDGSGNVISNLTSQLQHFLSAFALQNYTTGTWGAVPTFPGGTPKVRTSTFDTVRTIQAARVSGGYTGAFYVGQQRPTRQWLADLQVSADLRLGINHQGQIVAATLDNQAATSGLTGFGLTQIEASAFDIDPRIDAVYNVLEFKYGLEAATGRAAWPATTIRDTQSITDHGERIAQPVTLMALPILAHATDVANRRLFYAAQPIAEVAWRVDLRGLALALGQLVTVTHFAGIGGTGWTSRVLWITTITTDPNETALLCTIEAEDVDTRLATQLLVLDSGTIDTAVLA